MGPTGTAMASQIRFASLHDRLFLNLLFLTSCDSSFDTDEAVWFG
jgi:hypothetical protein